MVIHDPSQLPTKARHEGGYSGDLPRLRLDQQGRECETLPLQYVLRT